MLCFTSSLARRASGCFHKLESFFCLCLNIVLNSFFAYISLTFKIVEIRRRDLCNVKNSVWKLIQVRLIKGHKLDRGSL